MKICIIGHPRTRSSLLLGIVSSYYDIPLIGENLNKIGNTLYGSYVGEDHPVSMFYQKLLDGYLKQVFSKKKGVIRIHPTQLSYLNYSSKMIDLDRLSFGQYEKIYFTVRQNIPDMISSLFIAHMLKKFTYQNIQDVPKTVQPVALLPDLYFQSVEMLLYSELIMDRVKEYLTLHSIEYEELDYDNIPKHIEENFSNAVTTHVETEYDYSNIVTNYNELQTIYEQHKPIVYNRFCQDNKIDK